MDIIIKSDKDSFEKTINIGFEKAGVHIVSIEGIVKGKKGIAKIANIIKWIHKFKKNGSVDKFIVFDDTTCYLLIMLYYKNSFLWLWNTLPKTKGNIIKIPFCKLLGKVYSFDKNDCKKYSLKSNTQFMINYEVPDQAVQHDIYFVGADKGRYIIVNRVYEFCKTHSINTFFQLVPDEGVQYNKAVITNHFIDYREVIRNIAKSKAVLDICKPGQVGCTYRAMEALFFNKKIITNNSLYYNLDFYRPEMVFILDSECTNMEELLAFLRRESPGYSHTIREKYYIQNWLKRFV